MHRNILIGSLLVIGAATRPGAADWPEFRGPAGQGHATSTKLPVDWSSTRNVAWKKPIPGEGWSSPVLYRGRLYLTTSVSEQDVPTADRSLRTMCLDSTTGKVIWDKQVFLQDGRQAPKIHSKNSHASPTPIAAADRLYVHFGHQGTACLDLDGKIIWRNRRLQYAPVHGNGGSPILAGDKLVYSIDGRDQTMLVALDRRSGKLVWTADRRSMATKKFSFSTPLLITVNGRQQIVSPASDMVCSYDPADGHEIWRVRYDGYSVIPRPVSGHGMVFICTGYNTPSLLAIRPDGKGDVTDSHVAWTVKRGVPHTPSLLLVGKDLYMVSDRGIASCLEVRTGKVHWQERINGQFSASPLFANGLIYFQDEDGRGTVVRAGREFQPVRTNDLEERTLASYAAGDRELYIRSAEHLYRIQQN